MSKAGSFILAASLLVLLGTPALAANPTSIRVAASATSSPDPLIGPHAAYDAQHRNDTLSFRPATNKPMPRVATGPAFSAGSPTLTREVLGFAPASALAANQQGVWNYSLVSTLAYFGLDMNFDGTIQQSGSGWDGWNSTQLIDMVDRAHAAHDRVVVVIKAFDDATINGIVTVQAHIDAAIANTISAIGTRNLDGVNVDFEGHVDPNYPNLQSGFTNFMTQLSSKVHAQYQTAMVSADTYAGSASCDCGMFKIGDLAPVVDALFIMAYDMSLANQSGSGPAQALPNAPLNGWTYNDSQSVQQYLTKAPASKIILGVPLYGYKWSTKTAQPYAVATSGATAVTYSGVQDDFACAQSLARHWDSTAQSPWATWYSPPANDPCGGNFGSTRELYYDDATSLGMKFDLVNANNLLGTGSWELGFQGSYSDLWRMIQARFSPGSSTFYFAEGYTGAGFNETLYLLMPNQSGSATIDYYLHSGHMTQSVPLTIGQTYTVNVNAAVGANQEVSVRVSFPGQGVAERVMAFNNGSWHGSTEVTGVNAPASDWYFAEGSTLNAYSEYLSLENPNAVDVTATLTYQTDSGANPVKTTVLKANTRTTIEVMSGDLSTNANCTPGAGGSCGVGHGIGGVSVHVNAALPIIAERPFYVNNFNFGAGAIRDGHDAFGATAPATTWYFAEGTTLNDFNEYLTLQNPNPTSTAVTVTYLDTSGGQTVKTMTINPHTRLTVPVFGTQFGVGRGVGGVSTQVSSAQPIVAERPMYMVHDFGTGPVAGATDAVGATAPGNLFEVARGSTLSGENDYVTVENPGSAAAHVEITYWSTQAVVAVLTVGANSRLTAIVNSQGLGGIGPGQAILHFMLVSDRPVVVERPAYSTMGANYGATDTMGYTPTTF